MAVILSGALKAKFATQLADQQTAATTPVVCIVGESPNLAKSTRDVYGHTAQPDLSAAILIAKRYGTVLDARMVANPGLPDWLQREWERIGFLVDRGLGPDCDDRAVRQCAMVAHMADVLVCMGGDHAFIDILRLIKMSSRKITVVLLGVRACTAACLIDMCDEFIEIPIKLRGRVGQL